MRILKLINSKCSFMTSFKPYLFLFLWLSGVQIVFGQSISEKFLVKPYLQHGSQTGIFVCGKLVGPPPPQLNLERPDILQKKWN